MAATAGEHVDAILRRLAAHDVESIVVGGMGAVLHRAPVTTFDLDVVHDRDDANLSRLSSQRGVFGVVSESPRR